jgi:putative membrane protein
MGITINQTLSMVLPHLTAFLNALTGILLVIGYRHIRAGRRELHHRVMTAAVVSSALFLVSYVLNHLTAPVYVFRGQGIIRPIYFTMLTSHVILATAVTPMVALTYIRARRARAGTGTYARHKALARWTFPIWLYVSVTGIVVYLMVYHIYAAAS